MNYENRIFIINQNNLDFYIDVEDNDANKAYILTIDKDGNETKQKFEESFHFVFGNHKFNLNFIDYLDLMNVITRKNQLLCIDKILERADKCNKKIFFYYGKDENQEQMWGVKCNLCGHEAKKYARFFNQCSGCNNLNKVTDNEIFKKTASTKHNNRYLYSDDYVNTKTKIRILCKCGYIFYQRPNDHLKGSGCPKCKISSGELAIERWLLDHNEEYIWQHKFDNLRNIKPLKLDFYCASVNTIIEYDGEGHTELGFYINRGSKNPEKDLENAQYNDSLKNKYAEENGIKMLRISYKEKNNIAKILDNHFYGDQNAK